MGVFEELTGKRSIIPGPLNVTALHPFLPLTPVLSSSGDTAKMTLMARL